MNLERCVWREGVAHSTTRDKEVIVYKTACGNQRNRHYEGEVRAFNNCFYCGKMIVFKE